MSKPTVCIENVSDVIRETLCVFRGGRNWAKDTFQGESNQGDTYCLVGGIQAALGEGDRKAGRKHPLYEDTLSFVSKTIRGRNVKNAESTIIRFNDSVRTKFANVEAILAAALVEARKLAGVAS